jgi:hypothetical protein
MNALRITSVGDPFTDPDTLPAGIDLVRRAAALGIPAAAGERTLDLALVQEIAREASALGVGSAAAQLLLAFELEQPPDAPEIARLVGRLLDALVESPVPARELAVLDAILGGEVLGALLGTSPASLRRYLRGERPTPDPIAERAHWLSLVVSDLMGAYNEFGVRRWFTRLRTQLDGLSPAAVLALGWTPDDPPVARVAALAAALVSSGAGA